MQGLPIHDINIIVLTMLWGYTGVVYIYNVYKHWRKTRLYFGFSWCVTDSWTKLMRHLSYILQESMEISPMDVATTDCPFLIL